MTAECVGFPHKGFGFVQTNRDGKLEQNGNRYETQPKVGVVIAISNKDAKFCKRLFNPHTHHIGSLNSTENVMGAIRVTLTGRRVWSRVWFLREGVQRSEGNESSHEIIYLCTLIVLW